MSGLAERSWSSRARIGWWAKYIGGLAGTLIAVATAASLLGLKFDVQTATEARVQTEQLKSEFRSGDDRVRSEQSAALREVKDAITHLGDRIDNALVRRPR